MKRYIKASSGRASDVPPDLRPYYFAASKGEAAAAGYDTDYIGDRETVEFYKRNGYTWDGIIIAKPEYASYLEGELDCLDIVIDSEGNLVPVYIVHDRIYEVGVDEVERYLPDDMISDEDPFGVVEGAETINAFTLIDYCMGDPDEMVSHPTSLDEGKVEDWEELYNQIVDGSLDPVDFELDDIDQNTYVFLDGGDMIHLKDGTWVNICWRGSQCRVWLEDNSQFIHELNELLKK